MARRHTLIRTAIAGTALLWTATIASAITHITSQRIHIILLAGSFLAAVALLHIAGYMVVRRVMNAQADRLAINLHNLEGAVAAIPTELNLTVAQVADELHCVVAETGEVLRLDRHVVAQAHQILAALHTGGPWPRRSDKGKAA